MKTINLSPSQYRVVHSGSAVPVPVPNAVSSTARASRMSQSSSQCQATVPTATLTNTKRTTNHHPIYGIVNLALLAVSIYLLWANLI